MIGKNKKVIISCLVLVIAVVLIFWPITKTFYQQDEWLGYGLYLANGNGIIFQNAGGFWGTLLGQGRILTNLLYFLFYKYFPLNVFPIAIFAIVFHIINTLLIFFLAKKLFKNVFPAFLGSLFFAVCSVSQSAVIWPAASINTLPSTTLILISIAFYFKFLEINERKWILYGFLAIYFSLFFKETGIFLFLLFPLVSLLFKKFSFKNYANYFWYYFLATLLIVTFRLLKLAGLSHQDALFLTGSSKYFFDSLIVRSILYPSTSFSLSLIPTTSFLDFSRYITNVYYPFIPESQFILVAQTVVLDLLSTILTVVIIVSLVLLHKKEDIKKRKNLIFWFLFLFGSFLPYIVISKSFTYLESRYYYLASAAWGIIFAWIANLVVKKIKSRYVKVVFLIIFVIFLYIHARVLIKDINKLVGESQTRINILNQISEIKPKLDGKKNIFYVTGDTDYYLPGNKVPFQQGFGYTLLALYFPKSEYPSDFLENTDLFEIGKQGYYEVLDYGFGYFTDKNEMKIALKKYKITPSLIFWFHYDSKNGKLTEINDKTY